MAGMKMLNLSVPNMHEPCKPGRNLPGGATVQCGRRRVRRHRPTACPSPAASRCLSPAIAACTPSSAVAACAGSAAALKGRASTPSPRARRAPRSIVSMF